LSLTKSLKRYIIQIDSYIFKNLNSADIGATEQTLGSTKRSSNIGGTKMQKFTRPIVCFYSLASQDISGLIEEIKKDPKVSLRDLQEFIRTFQPAHVPEEIKEAAKMSGGFDAVKYKEAFALTFCEKILPEIPEGRRLTFLYDIRNCFFKSHKEEKETDRVRAKLNQLFDLYRKQPETKGVKGVVREFRPGQQNQGQKEKIA